MKVAVTVWGSRISPVFDAAKMLCLFDLKCCTGGSLNSERFSFSDIRHAVSIMNDNGVKRLICGAICQESALEIEQAGIRVTPFMSGEVSEVILGFALGKDMEKHIMPGCSQCRCPQKS